MFRPSSYLLKLTGGRYSAADVPSISIAVKKQGMRYNEMITG